MDYLFRRNLSPCGAITSGSGADCDDLPEGGTRARLILFNQEDITGYTETDGVISAITLAGGATGYEFLGFRNDVGKSEEVIKPEIGIPKFKHVVRFVVYENTQEQKNNVENLVRGLFVAVVENMGKDYNVFEVVGKGVGLEIVAGEIRNAYANGGYFVINLATPDDQGKLEAKLPQTLQVGGTYASTLAYLATKLPAS